MLAFPHVFHFEPGGDHEMSWEVGYGECEVVPGTKGSSVIDVVRVYR